MRPPLRYPNLFKVDLLLGEMVYVQRILSMRTLEHLMDGTEELSWMQRDAFASRLLPELELAKSEEEIQRTVKHVLQTFLAEMGA